ncbi:MAG: amidohydrolase [Candidatus Cloacimonetes bacterium]|nr:amidohydrolase [Candidatus Cloacimonadota bacterium]
MQKADIVIRDGLLLTINREMDIIENGAVAICGNKIKALGTTEEITADFQAGKTIFAKGKIIMPGLINAHTHIPMTYFRGIADDLPLQTWLQDYIWPTESRFLNREFVYHAALHGAAEMIKNGITLFNDMYFLGKESARAATEAGIRGIIGEGLLDIPLAGHKNADEVIDYVKSARSEFAGSELIDFTIAPHAVYSCSSANLIKARKLAEEFDLLLHIHVSETEQEVLDAIQKFGKRPVHYLEDLGFLEQNVIFAHGIWVDEWEIRIMKKRSIAVAITTESHLKLASGFAPVRSYLENGVTVCLGTDGVSSNNNLDLLTEMDLTAKLHKAYNQDPTQLQAAQVVRMVTIDAARALHKDEFLGSLEPGKLADIILLDTNTLEAQPMYNPYSHLVYTLNSSAVSTVIINGSLVMEERKLLTVDEAELIGRAGDYRQMIRENLNL